MSDKTTVQLVRPIERKDGAIAAVTLHEPSVGALRGLKLFELMRMDTASMQTLLPRITEPALMPDEIAALKTADFFSLATAVMGFFMTPDQVAAAQAEAAG